MKSWESCEIQPDSIFFITVLWGSKFVNYFRQHTLPSLGHQLRAQDRFVFACPSEDFPSDLPNAIHVSFWPDPSAPVYKNQNEGQKRLLKFAFNRAAWASVLSPDCIVSDNYVSTLVRLQAAGYDLVQHTALRQNEDTWKAEVGERTRFSARELAGLNIRHLHRECSPFFAGSSAMPWLPPLLLWHSGDDALIIHSYISNPILMNFGRLRSLDLNCVKEIAVENIFLDYNFMKLPNLKRYLVTDSDELGVCSLSPDYSPAWHPRAPRSEWWMNLGLRMSKYLWPKAGRFTFLQAQVWHAGDKCFRPTFPMFTRLFCIRAFRFDPLAFALGHLARAWLLHFLPWAKRVKDRGRRKA